MESSNIKNILESLLFVANKPLKIKELSAILEVEQDHIKSTLDELLEERKNSGIVLLESSGQYQLATNPANAEKVKNFLNADLREKLTDATVEVLAIISYRQPISKAEIESIRGVNSQYSLRHLLMRGLIEKIPNPSDARGFLYQTTTEFLMHMGLSSTNDLPEFEKLAGEIKLPETPEMSAEQTAQEGEPKNPEEAPEANEPPTENSPETMVVISEIPAPESEPKDEFDEEEDEDDEKKT